MRDDIDERFCFIALYRLCFDQNGDGDLAHENDSGNARTLDHCLLRRDIYIYSCAMYACLGLMMFTCLGRVNVRSNDLGLFRLYIYIKLGRVDTCLRAMGNFDEYEHFGQLFIETIDRDDFGVFSRTIRYVTYLRLVPRVLEVTIVAYGASLISFDVASGGAIYREIGTGLFTRLDGGLGHYFVNALGYHGDNDHVETNGNETTDMLSADELARFCTSVHVVKDATAIPTSIVPQRDLVGGTNIYIGGAIGANPIVIKTIPIFSGRQDQELEATCEIRRGAFGNSFLSYYVTKIFDWGAFYSFGYRSGASLFLFVYFLVSVLFGFIGDLECEAIATLLDGTF